MAGRAFPWPTLALLIALAAPAAARAVDILRLKPAADGTAPLSLVADQTFQWAQAGEDVYLLGGSVWIQQGQTEVGAPRAVVWLDAQAVRNHEPVRVVVYAAQQTNNHQHNGDLN